jgi:hypothetical protein
MRPAVIFAIMLCCTFTMSSGRADDFYLYDKGGFRINLASNGGNCFGCEWLETLWRNSIRRRRNLTTSVPALTAIR